MIGALITIAVYVLVLGLLYWLMEFLIERVPIGEPFAKVLRIVVTVLFVLIIILLLLRLIGVGDIPLPRIG